VVAWAVAVTAIWVGFGFLLTHVASHDAIGRFDLATERWLAEHRDAVMNGVTRILSDMAGTKVVVIVGLGLAAMAGATWRRWREPAMLVVALIGEVGIFLSITALVHRPRPPVLRLDRAPPTSSFPSGHTSASVVLYGTLAILASERFRGTLVHVLVAVFAFVMPVLVAGSRLYRGLHYPTDVVAGAVLGAAWLMVSLHAVRMGVFHRKMWPGRPGPGSGPPGST